MGAYGQQLDREMAGYVLEDTRLSTLQRKLSKVRASGGVADPCHFGVDPDPDPRIHASD